MSSEIEVCFLFVQENNDHSFTPYNGYQYNYFTSLKNIRLSKFTEELFTKYQTQNSEFWGGITSLDLTVYAKAVETDAITEHHMVYLEDVPEGIPLEKLKLSKFIKFCIGVSQRIFMGNFAGVR